MDSWQTSDLPDWRFPLVGRVPDAAARLALNRLLDRLWNLGIVGGKTRVAVVAYGSCVEGTARKGSDLDLLILAGPPTKQRQIKEAAAETNLGVERKIDVRVLSPKEFEDLPQAVKVDIRQGKTVYRSSPELGLVEALS